MLTLYTIAVHAFSQRGCCQHKTIQHGKCNVEKCGLGCVGRRIIMTTRSVQNDSIYFVINIQILQLPPDSPAASVTEPPVHAVASQLFRALAVERYGPITFPGLTQDIKSTYTKKWWKQPTKNGFAVQRAKVINTQ